MTLHAFADEPDGWEPQYDPWEEWEDFEPGRFFWPDPSEAPGESDLLHVDFVLGPRDRGLAWATTIGLWRMGLPELVFRPPGDLGLGGGFDEARFAHFLGNGLMELGIGLLSAEGFETSSYQGDLDGRTVRLWLGGHEPPFPQLAAFLGPEVDTVIKVKCSLWP